MTTRSRRRSLLLLPVLVLGLSCSRGDGTAGDGTIKIGAVFDLSGVTADIGTPWSEGVRDHFAWRNEEGGIAGRPLELLFQDYGYRVDVAEQLYSEFVHEGAVAFIGWGTGDTEALRGRIAADEIPFISASFSHVLGDPELAPYNFLAGTSYSDQLAILLDWIVEREGGEAPATVAAVHMPHPAGLSPILQGGADYAADLGIELVPHEMPRGSTDFSALLTRVAESEARYVIFQSTSSPAALALRNAAALGLDFVFACLNYCTNEILIELAGEAAEGMVGAMLFSPPGEGVVGFAEAEEYLTERGSSLAEKGLLYGQGWSMASLLLEGVARAAAASTDEVIRGAAVRDALESMRDYDTGGVTTPVTFTPDDHRGIKGMRIFQVRDGRWQPLTGLRRPATPVVVGG